MRNVYSENSELWWLSAMWFAMRWNPEQVGKISRKENFSWSNSTLNLILPMDNASLPIFHVWLRLAGWLQKVNSILLSFVSFRVVLIYYHKFTTRTKSEPAMMQFVIVTLQLNSSRMKQLRRRFCATISSSEIAQCFLLDQSQQQDRAEYKSSWC